MGIIEHFAEVGSHRLLIEVAALSLELALQRGARWVALRQLELARTHLAQLRQDRGAAALVAGLAARIDALPDVAPLPVPADRGRAQEVQTQRIPDRRCFQKLRQTRCPSHSEVNRFRLRSLMWVHCSAPSTRR